MKTYEDYQPRNVMDMEAYVKLEEPASDRGFFSQNELNGSVRSIDNLRLDFTHDVTERYGHLM